MKKTLDIHESKHGKKYAVVDGKLHSVKANGTLGAVVNVEAKGGRTVPGRDYVIIPNFNGRKYAIVSL